MDMILFGVPFRKIDELWCIKIAGTDTYRPFYIYEQYDGAQLLVSAMLDEIESLKTKIAQKQP